MIRLFYLPLLITFLLDSLFSGALDCIYGDDCLDFRFHSSRNQNQLAVEEYNVFFWIVSCRGGLVLEFISNCLSNNLYFFPSYIYFFHIHVPFLVLVWLSLSQKTVKKWGLLLHLFLFPLSLQNLCTKVIIWRSRLLFDTTVGKK